MLEFPAPLAGYIASQHREPEILQRLRAETLTLGSAAEMLIDAGQGALMALLVRITNARQILEIGTFTGYSTLAMALALPKRGRIVACDISDDWTRIARRYWAEAGVADKIDLRLAPALHTLGELEKESQRFFDIAFIDADKTNSLAYFEACIELVTPGGLILIDNSLWSGRVADPADTSPDTLALRALNAAIATDGRVDPVLLSIGDGLTICRVRE